MLNRVKYIYKPSGERGAQIIPAWDKFIKCVLTLNASDTIPDKHDRYLLDNGIRNRIPSSVGRAVKAIETFMLDWLGDPDARRTLIERMTHNPELNDIHLLVGKAKPDGSVNISLATRKGFIVVTFSADRFSS